MTYNPWYCATYEHILEIADWAHLSTDIEKKMVGVFSWMPQTIMAIKTTGRRFRYELYDPDAIANALHQHEDAFLHIRSQVLIEVNLEEHTPLIKAICNTLFPALGSVASSKYLHFSAPTLLPMWDRHIRVARGHEDTVDGFIAYIAEFKEELSDPQNLHAARERYPDNPVRGWDIIGMENR